MGPGVRAWPAILVHFSDDMEVIKFLKEGAESVSRDLTGYSQHNAQTSIFEGYTLYQEYGSSHTHARKEPKDLPNDDVNISSVTSWHVKTSDFFRRASTSYKQFTAVRSFAKR